MEEEKIIPEFIVLVGVSGCGKTSFAKKFAANNVDRNSNPYTVISSDDVRKELSGGIFDQSKNEEVFSTIHKRIKMLLREGNSVIVDATNLKLKNRKAYINVTKRIKTVRRCFIFNETPSFCISNQKNEDRELHLDAEVIQRQIRSFEIPFYNEGWDEILFIRNREICYQEFNVPKIKSVQSTDLFTSQIGFNQKNKHHLYTLDVHSIKVAEAIHKYPVPYKLVENDEDLYRLFLYSKALMEEVAYVHDYGKMFTGVPKNDGSGDYKYFNHHNMSAYLIMNSMNKLGLHDYDTILDFLFYVNYHMQPFFINTPKAEKKWREIFGNWRYEMLTIFNQCDIIGSGTRKERVGVN